jgi:DNA methylase
MPETPGHIHRNRLRKSPNNSSPGQAVYDAFIGSSTTMIACELTGRHCLGIELNPAYVDVGILRWQNFSGGVATLESTGQTFVEVMADRQPNQPIKATLPASARIS